MDLPKGTVTFLFTDIEGSTRLWEQAPAAAKQALERHDALVEQAVAANSGQVVRPRGEGDSRFAVFARATDATAAARDIQLALAAEPWPLPQPLRVRMALHTGEADWREGDYYGSEVNRCARLRALASGGQVLLSQTTYVLVRDALPSGLGVRDLGEHRLRDLQRPEHVYQLVLPNLPTDFPPLKSLDLLPNNLPPQLTSFVGRETELRRVKELLEGTRLLTLTGPGGTGKTRLALQAAAELVDRFRDGAWFVDLSQVGDPDAVVQPIVRALGVRDLGDRPPRELLADYMRDKELLLILDNFEQVIDAAPVVKDLLLSAPTVKMLVTSRILLRVSGEQEYEVPQFLLPDPAHLPSLEQLSHYEAVRLFIERARAFKPDWTITNENAPAVAEICYRLDGLPLAIELAAARVRLMPPSQMLAQLGSTMNFLKSPSRDLPARQQTLRGAIDWSYNLLSREEQTLFRQLAVFAGGATLDAIEAVCGLDDGVDVLTELESLVDKSLVRLSEAQGQSRFAMLGTIREYAAVRLKEDETGAAASRRSHAVYYADLTECQREPLMGEGREAALALLAADVDNIRAAWRYWISERNLEQLNKFTDALWMLNDARGWYQASVDLINDLLKVLSFTDSSPERAREEIALQTSLARALLVVKGYFTTDAEQAYARALELSEREGETEQLFPILRGLASFYSFRGEYEKLIQMAERMLALANRCDEPTLRVEAHLRMGANLFRPKEGLAHLEEALKEYDPGQEPAGRLRLGTNPGIAILTTSALLLWITGAPDRARRRASEAMGLARRLEHPFSMAYCLFHYGLVHLWLRDAEIARARADELVTMAAEHEFQLWSAVGTCLKGAALSAMGSAEEGLARMQEGLKTYQALKTPPAFFPIVLMLQAGACLAANKPEEGLGLIDMTLSIAGVAGSSSLAAEANRLKADLLLAGGQERREEAEVYYRRAIEIAKESDALMLELRAAMSLDRLWRECGKGEEGREVVRGVYDRFTEGFTTPDLKEARALLDLP